MLTGCRECRKQLIELARGSADAETRRALLEHVEICADCARALDNQVALSAAFGRLKNDPVPELKRIEDRVLAEFDRTARRRVIRWIVVAGIAAALFFGVVLLERPHPVQRPYRPVVAQVPVSIPAPPPEPPSRVQQVKHPVNQRRPQPGAPFVAIPYTIPLSPQERTTVVRMDIPVAALIAVGFDVPDADPGGTVEADVLVSQDGRARAIRPVR